MKPKTNRESLKKIEPFKNSIHRSHLLETEAERAKEMSFEEFKPLNEKSLVEYIKATPSLSSRLGDKYDDLVIKEVGDGNLNFVFIVVGSTGSLVIKQVAFFISLKP